LEYYYLFFESVPTFLASPLLTKVDKLTLLDPIARKEFKKYNGAKDQAFRKMSNIFMRMQYLPALSFHQPLKKKIKKCCASEMIISTSVIK